MEKTKLIELLNEALQTEYTDVFLYPREADRLKEKEISETFESFGRMELRHTDNIAMQIHALGGEPKWEFDLLQTEESIEEMLHGHLEREEKAVQLYNSLIELADKEKEDQLKLILKGIMSEEVTHVNTIKDLIQKGK